MSVQEKQIIVVVKLIVLIPMVASNVIVNLVLPVTELIVLVKYIYFDFVILLFIINFKIDINECTSEIDDCNWNKECKNTIGSYKCFCQEGFKSVGKDCIGMFI
jgi:hypothetical protein